MKSSAWLFAAAMSVSTLALAQSAQSSGVTESTDPAKISAIEQHAQELASRPAGAATADQGGDMATHKPRAKDKPPSDTPMATEGKS
jgi:phosphate-selective porin